MTHASEKRELERLALMFRQNVQATMQKVTKVSARNCVRRRMRFDRTPRLLINVLLISIFRATVSLFAAKTINRAPARKRNDPAE